MIDRYHEHSSLFLQQLPKGVFITVKGSIGVNTMTIAWGHIGVIWGKPVFVAYVRYSRHTYDVLRSAKDFTINVPKYGTMQDALRIAGTTSGRQNNKFETAGITMQSSRKVTSPIIAECALHYECDIIYTQSQEPGLIPTGIQERYYPNHDTHIMFYGEILDSYLLHEGD